MLSMRSLGTGVVVGSSLTAAIGYLLNNKNENSKSLDDAYRLGKQNRVKPLEFPDGRKRWDSNWDRRDPAHLIPPMKETNLDANMIDKRKEDLKKAKAKVTRRLILIRHGQYENENENGILTPLGRKQATLTGQRMKVFLDQLEENLVDENGNKKPVNFTLVKSTMARAQETGNLILDELKDKNIDVQNCDLLREGAPIEPVPPISPALWNPEPRDFYEEGSRIEAAFRRYIKRADANEEIDMVDILVCHGNVIRYFVCRALQVPPDAWLRFALGNGSVTMLHVRPSGRVGITTMGETGHFPRDMLTFN